MPSQSSTDPNTNKTGTGIFEEGVPLDSSVLWSWIRHYYSHGGVAVWSEGDVPFHITNTPVLARDWADSVLVMLRDFARLGRLSSDSPVEVFELGPGTGRHAYFLLRELKRLEHLTQVFIPGGVSFRLHLAELGESGLKSLSEHPNWRAALECGDLLLHQFDIDADSDPKLYGTGDTGFALPSRNPVFVISNYILDSLPHDVLRIRGGRIQRGLTRLGVKGLKAGVKPTQLKDLGEKIDLTFQYEPHEVSYPDPHWNQIVDLYRVLTDETYVPFPTSALRLANRSRGWSEVATVFLVADKSFTLVNQLEDLEEPELVPHGGGFSFNANLHALGSLAELLGGFCHHTPSRDGTLDLSHMVFPGFASEPESWAFPESRFRFEDLEKFHAVDRFRIKESVDDLTDEYPLRLCLDLLRLAGFDPQVFYELSDNILKGLEEDTEVETEDELAQALALSLELIYPLPDDVDVAFEIGRVAYRLELYERAHHAFSLSLEQYGDDPRTRFNLGLTWYYREHWKRARKEFDLAVKLDPQYQEAKRWVAKTAAKMKGLSAASVK